MWGVCVVCVVCVWCACVHMVCDVYGVCLWCVWYVWCGFVVGVCSMLVCGGGVWVGDWGMCGV